MDCTLNTLFSTLEGTKPLNEQKLVGTPFGGLYSTEKIDPGAVWGLFDGCVKYFAPDYSDSMRKGAIANFLTRLVPRIDVLQTALSDFKDLRLLQLQAKPYDDRKFRQVQQELAQVTVRLNIFFKHAGDIDEMRVRYKELVVLFQGRVPSEIFTAHIPQDGVVELLEECWHEYQDYRWVPRLQREIGVLPVSKLRQIVENNDFEVSRDSDLKRFVNNLNKAHSDGRLTLDVLHCALVMVVEAMDGVAEGDRGQALGLIGMRLEDAGCKLFDEQEQGREEFLKAQDTYPFNVTDFVPSATAIVNRGRKEISIPLEGGRSLLYSTVNEMRLAIDMARVGRDAGDKWAGLNILPKGTLSTSGDCALVEGNLVYLCNAAGSFDENSLVKQLGVVAKGTKIPAGRLGELLCVGHEGTIFWNLLADGDQPVNPSEIEKYLNSIAPEKVHDWMVRSGLGATDAAKQAREVVYAALDRGEGTLWDTIGLRAQALRKGYNEFSWEDIRDQFKTTLRDKWYREAGIVNTFSPEFLMWIQGFVIQVLDDKLEASRKAQEELRCLSRGGSSDGVQFQTQPSTPTKRASRKFGLKKPGTG